MLCNVCKEVGVVKELVYDSFIGDHLFDDFGITHKTLNFFVGDDTFLIKELLDGLAVNDRVKVYRSVCDKAVDRAFFKCTVDFVGGELVEKELDLFGCDDGFEVEGLKKLFKLALFEDAFDLVGIKGSDNGFNVDKINNLVNIDKLHELVGRKLVCKIVQGKVFSELTELCGVAQIFEKSYRRSRVTVNDQVVNLFGHNGQQSFFVEGLGREDVHQSFGINTDGVDAVVIRNAVIRAREYGVGSCLGCRRRDQHRRQNNGE